MVYDFDAFQWTVAGVNHAKLSLAECRRDLVQVMASIVPHMTKSSAEPMWIQFYVSVQTIRSTELS